MYADPYDSEYRTFPFGLVVTAIFVIGGALLLWISSVKPANPPVPPWPLTGCYSTPGGPDLLFDPTSVTILQKPPVKIRSSVRFVKGWAFEIDTWLNFRETAGGAVILEPGAPSGEFLQISREGEFAAPVPSFELADRRTSQAIRYARTGSSCNLRQAG